jgi:hypothetical protein
VSERLFTASEVIRIAEETSDSLGNLYRLDFIRRMTWEARAGDSDAEALIGVIRPNGQATFHRQDCSHAKRATTAHYYLPSDFAPGDHWCSSCRPAAIHPD